MPYVIRGTKDSLASDEFDHVEPGPNDNYMSKKGYFRNRKRSGDPFTLDINEAQVWFSNKDKINNFEYVEINFVEI